MSCTQKIRTPCLVPSCGLGKGGGSVVALLNRLGKRAGLCSPLQLSCRTAFGTTELSTSSVVGEQVLRFILGTESWQKWSEYILSTRKGRVLIRLAEMGLLITTWPSRNSDYHFSVRYHSLASVVLEMGSCNPFS